MDYPLDCRKAYGKPLTDEERAEIEKRWAEREEINRKDHIAMMSDLALQATMRMRHGVAWEDLTDNERAGYNYFRAPDGPGCGMRSEDQDD